MVINMYKKNDLIKGIASIGVKPTDTLLIHSSMKALGQVEGGPDTVIDAFIEYLEDGLLIFPTHTWEQMNEKYNLYDSITEPSCVGLLTNYFRKRPGVVRSLHPTHSVAALGKDAADYIAGEEKIATPCDREGCWGKLYDRGAKILFLGCSLKKNTFLHGVEEWNNIPNRLMEKPVLYKIKMPDGSVMDRPFRGHHSTLGDVSQYYDKMLQPFLHYGIAKEGKIGDGDSVLCDAIKMSDLVSKYLKKNQKLFNDGEPIPTKSY
ncbi:MAG: AAC(3) family N-acetyltransferase [Clostridiales bacterium]|nr:AAC(3) family N-acetyltransferase [Clostridiales bacterium]